MTAEREYAPQCRPDGRCQYAIDHGAEGMGHCPPDKCAWPDYERRYEVERAAGATHDQAHHVASTQSFLKPEVDALMPYGLHPKTKRLIIDFAVALGEKLHAAEKKYGYDDGWSGSAWETDCRDRLHEHLAKGDPRDVANYCAFMWYHGWSTTPVSETAPTSQPSATEAHLLPGLQCARLTILNSEDTPIQPYAIQIIDRIIAQIELSASTDGGAKETS